MAAGVECTKHVQAPLQQVAAAMLRKAEARRAARASDEVEVGRAAGDEDESSEEGEQQSSGDEGEQGMAGWGAEESDEEPEAWEEDAGTSDEGEDDRLEAYELSDDDAEAPSEAPNGHAATVSSKKKLGKKHPKQKRTVSALPPAKRAQKKRKAN